MLAKQGIGEELAQHLRVMRAACRRFLGWFHPRDDTSSLVVPHAILDFELNQALGELRAAFGFQIALIAAKYDLEVEEPLSYVINTALPTEQDFEKD